MGERRAPQILEGRPRQTVLRFKVTHHAVRPDARSCPLHDAHTRTQGLCVLILRPFGLKYVEVLNVGRLANFALGSKLVDEFGPIVEPGGGLSVGERDAA